MTGMYAIIGVEAFGSIDADLFGDLSNSTFTLFQARTGARARARTDTRTHAHTRIPRASTFALSHVTVGPESPPW